MNWRMDEDNTSKVNFKTMAQAYGLELGFYNSPSSKPHHI